MNHDKETQKAALTDEIVASIKKQMGPGIGKIATSYVEQCFRRVPVEDLVLHSPKTLAAIVRGQLKFLQQRVLMAR